MQGLCSFAPQQTGEPSSFRPCDGKSLPELVKATGKKIRKVRETLLNERAIYVFIGTASKDCRGGWISRSTKGTVNLKSAVQRRKHLAEARRRGDAEFVRSFRWNLNLQDKYFNGKPSPFG